MEIWEIDFIYQCEHCGAFRIKRIDRFKYAKGDDNEVFCYNVGEVKVCSEQPTPLSEEISNMWKEGSLRGNVLRKHGRQINSALFLVSFRSNNELCKKDTIYHLLFKEHLTLVFEHYNCHMGLNQSLHKYIYMILLMLVIIQG